MSTLAYHLVHPRSKSIARAAPNWPQLPHRLFPLPGNGLLTRVPAEFKASKVVTPLVRALGPGGRLVGVHSHGHDPGMEIIHRIWPDEQPFVTGRADIIRAVRAELGKDQRHYHVADYPDSRAIFRYDMHTLPSEISASSIGTSTLFAAWNAAVYVAQIDDERLGQVVSDRRYLDATSAVLQARGGLWFNDESYVISCKRS